MAELKPCKTGKLCVTYYDMFFLNRPHVTFLSKNVDKNFRKNKKFQIFFGTKSCVTYLKSHVTSAIRTGEFDCGFIVLLFFCFF